MSCGDVNPNTRVTCGIEVKGHNGKIQLWYSSLDHHQFGNTFLVLLCEELLVMFSLLLLKLHWEIREQFKGKLKK